MWSQETAPILHPMISDREYLMDHHILVCICSEDDNEVLGKMIVSILALEMHLAFNLVSKHLYEFVISFQRIDVYIFIVFCIVFLPFLLTN